MRLLAILFWGAVSLRETFQYLDDPWVFVKLQTFNALKQTRTGLYFQGMYNIRTSVMDYASYRGHRIFNCCEIWSCDNYEAPTSVIFYQACFPLLTSLHQFLFYRHISIFWVLGLLALGIWTMWNFRIDRILINRPHLYLKYSKSETALRKRSPSPPIRKSRSTSYAGKIVKKIEWQSLEINHCIVDLQFAFSSGKPFLSLTYSSFIKIT